MKVDEIIGDDSDADLIRKEVKKRKGRNIKMLARKNNPAEDDSAGPSGPRGGEDQQTSDTFDMGEVR